MATIGRKAAVARIAWPFHAHWSGFMAWAHVARGAHLLPHRLPQSLGVFRQWAYTYIRKQEGVRLIVGSQDLPGWEALAAPAGDPGRMSPH